VFLKPLRTPEEEGTKVKTVTLEIGSVREPNQNPKGRQLLLTAVTPK